MLRGGPSAPTRRTSSCRSPIEGKARDTPGPNDITKRYRKAADLAIEQLDWVIRYLHQIRKHEIARALQRNRASIVKRYRGY
jgi:hypothetical protein